MTDQFFQNQTSESKKIYVDLLEVTGSLSNLFAESKTPFLYYRAMENIFCKAFEADNLSRSDVSADAGKDGVGIGLKTFLQNNGRTFQKVAEFNRNSYQLRELSNKEIVQKVAHMRNERISSTMRICGLNDMMYHLVTRSQNKMAIYEEHMDYIAIDNIKITKESKNTIQFTDDIHEYSFSLSKNTLLKRFDTSNERKIYDFDVMILEDPYEFLLSKSMKEENPVFSLAKDEVDFIILPLYSPRTGHVEAKSGLNQWNASGRKRNPDEVYIPIPSWIHSAKPDFFEYNTEDRKTAPFDVKLPNGNIISMKVAQQGGKALMSNPNSVLGKWLLRDILQLVPGKLVTIEQLDTIGIDSVKLTKLTTGGYTLDFTKSGTYEEFVEQCEE